MKGNGESRLYKCEACKRVLFCKRVVLIKKGYYCEGCRIRL
ncbi:MAG: hypothetical protein AABY22_21890 [Nanoarchaeota archaeon]